MDFAVVSDQEYIYSMGSATPSTISSIHSPKNTL